jgi:8-amino-3,8-dideoxy-alpha-D-manno-octulosonate transaminase
MNIEQPPYHKFSTDELMELVDLFDVSAPGQAAIRAVLEREAKPPHANLFRYYNQRSKVEQLEREFAAKMGVRYALGVNSGTSALIAALVAAGVGPGDEVIVPAYTFFASPASVVVAKAIPVITEIDESLTLDPAAVEANITPRTKAVMVVHMNGYNARMDALRDIARRRSVILIEDTAQATGGTYKGRYLGTWSDLGCFSFDAYKVMASGEGGMIATDDEWLYTRAQSYHDTAACWRPNRYARERRPGELFCGENYRMSEMSGAIARAQLRKLDWVNESTRAIWRKLREQIKLPRGVRWIEPADPDGVCGYMLGLLFDSHELAAKAIGADIGIGGLAGGGTQGSRDWHVYWYWDQILEQKTATAEGCPFKCQHVEALPHYSPEMCPRTRDVMLRTGFIGISPADTPQWADALAQRVSEGLARVT